MDLNKLTLSLFVKTMTALIKLITDQLVFCHYY